MYTLSVVFLNKFISGSDLELRKMKLIKLVKCKETTYETGYHSLVFQCNINLFLWNIHPKKIVLLCSLFLPTRCRFRAFLHNRRHTLSLAVTYAYTHTHTHTHTHIHSVGLPWKRDRPIAKACTYTTHNNHKRELSMSTVDSNLPSQQVKGRSPAP